MWGQIIGASIGAISARRATNKSVDEADKLKWWQQEMSSTAHQREVADLRAAGLNPILSAGGRGASTPGGGMGQVFDEGAGAANVGSAYSAARLRKEDVKNRQQERRNMRQQERNAVVDEFLKKEQINLTRQQRLTSAKQADAFWGQYNNQMALAALHGAEADIALNEEDISDAMKKGHLDAASLWSGKAGAAKRRSDMAAGAIKSWLDLYRGGRRGQHPNRRRRR
jgi:hypothetical protein